MGAKLLFSMLLIPGTLPPWTFSPGLFYENSTIFPSFKCHVRQRGGILIQL